MAQYFDAYLKGVQARAYKSQLDKAAQTEQARAAMHGAPQKDPRGWLSRKLGLGDEFTPMSEEEGVSAMYSLDPEYMERQEDRALKRNELKIKDEDRTRARRQEFSTSMVPIADDLLSAPDDATRTQLYKERYAGALAEQFPELADQIQQGLGGDDVLTAKEVEDIRALAVANLGKDPANPAPGKKPSDVASFEFYQGLSDEEKAEFLKVKRTDTRFDVAGVTYFRNPDGTIVPVTTRDEVDEGLRSGESAKNRGKSEEGRLQLSIDEGRGAAQGVPTLKRAIELLDSVKTGGYAKAALVAKQTFGIESADEAELNSMLGEAVLGDLRRTFGAQFTQTEGERLERIRANFGKSTDGNRRLLQQALDIANKAANRAMKAAAASGDYRAAAEIQEMMDETLSPDGAAGDEATPAGQTAVNPKTGERIQKMSDGSWVPVQ